MIRKFRDGRIKGYGCDNVGCSSPVFLRLTKDNLVLLNGNILHSCSKKCKHEILGIAKKILK